MWNAGTDGLELRVGGFDGAREYSAVRDGDRCHVSVIGRNGDWTNASTTVDAAAFAEAVLPNIPSEEWLPYYENANILDGFSWHLHVRWDGRMLVDSGGHENGPEGYGNTLCCIEDALCAMLGVATPREQYSTGDASEEGTADIFEYIDAFLGLEPAGATDAKPDKGISSLIGRIDALIEEIDAFLWLEPAGTTDAKPDKGIPSLMGRIDALLEEINLLRRVLPDSGNADEPKENPHSADE